jgi:outer membrane protein
MKKKSYFSFVCILLLCSSIQSQTKVWTLEECVKYAIDNNISIKQSELDTKSAEINKKDAVGSFIPSLNGSASHYWNTGLSTDPTTNMIQNTTTQYSSLSATVYVDIYKGMQNLNTLRKTNLSIIAAKYQLTKMQEDVALNVANAFLQVLFNKEYLVVQQEQKAINEKQLARSEELVKAGSVPRGDLLDSKATVASDNQKVIAAENALLISKLTLAQLLQLKDFYDFDVADEASVQDENNILDKTPVAIYEKAKEERIELKIARTNLEIAQKSMAIAKGAYQPTLQGFYSFSSYISYADTYDYSTGLTSAADSFSKQFSDNKGQSFGLELSIPIFNGFSVRNSVERTKVSLEESKLALEQQELDLQRNVYTAFTDAKGALNSYESSLVTLDARKEAYSYASEKYAVGMMNSFDFNQAQTLLSTAQSDVLRAKYDYIFKIKILEFYFGIPILKN